MGSVFIPTPDVEGGWILMVIRANAVYILKEYQRRGVGRSITRRVAAWLRESGYSSMVAWVLKGNPAAVFYSRLGGQPAGEKIVEIGGNEYLESAYGWQDLDRFGT